VSTRGSDRPAPSPPSGAGRDEAGSDRVGPDTVGLSPEEIDVLFRVGDILRKIDFGTLLIVVQDGKVVQLEVAEKMRLR
jgi:hypothetical protein